jgi:hypothetical protein
LLLWTALPLLLWTTLPLLLWTTLPLLLKKKICWKPLKGVAGYVR